MVNTVRSLTALLALFADTDTEDIAPQDVRDFIVSAIGGYGSLSVFEGSTQQDNPDTGAKLTCWTTNGEASGATPSHSDDQITIDVDGTWDIAFQASFSGTLNSTVKFRLRKNGTELNFGCTRKLGNIDVGSASFISCGVPLVATDILSIYVEMDGATDDITIVDAQLRVHRVG